MDSKLDLNTVIRPTLIRLEDSIIFHLFERTHFKTNDIIYTPGKIKVPNKELSFMDYLFRGTEELHATAGRYLHPEEHSFFDNLPESLIPRRIEENPIKENNLNFNPKIREIYQKAIHKICKKGDDGHYGSTAVCDIRALQDISRRVHYGLFVAESKFQKDPKEYTRLISDGDVDGIRDKLRNIPVEKKILERVRRKGEKFGVNPEFVEKFYENEIIPLTINIEVEYFLLKN